MEEDYIKLKVFVKSYLDTTSELNKLKKSKTLQKGVINVLEQKIKILTEEIKKIL